VTPARAFLEEPFLLSSAQIVASQAIGLAKRNGPMEVAD
jgi:hypothetical protein